MRATRVLLGAFCALALACHGGAAAVTGAARPATAPDPAAAAPESCTSNPEQLRAERERAMERGVVFMAGYIGEGDRLFDMGTDGVLIFLELALTSASPSVRAQAEPVARRHAQRLLASFL